MTFRNIQVVLSGNKTNLSSTLYAAGNEVDRFNNRVQQGNLKTAQSAKLVGAAFLAGGTAIAVGLGYAIVKAAQFDKSMRNVNSLLGLNEKQFAALEERVLSLSTQLPQSANTLAEGLYDIAGSGFAGADGLKVLEASAAAASAGMTDTATSAQAITATLNAYGRGAEDAADVSDVLFKTVDQGVIGFGELSGVIGDVVGTAAAAKVGIDQVGSAIATMTLTGISGAEAGTSLNRVLQSIIQPSKGLAGLFEQLGYESGAAALEQDGLRVVMDKVREATGGNITTLLELFPEIRAARGALALMANEGQNYARVSAQIEDAEARRGATQRALNEQMKAVSNQWALFKNGADAAAISLGTKLLPAVVGVMGVMGDLGSMVKQGATIAANQLGPSWEALADIARDLWQIGGDLVEVFGPIAAGMLAVVGVPLAATLNVILGVVASLTGFLADHREIVLALAIAYGALKVQTLLAAGGGAAAMAWRVISTALVGTIGAADGAAAAFGRLRLAQAAATLGVTAAISGAVMSWMSYRDVVSRVETAVNSANRAIKQGSLDGLDQQKRALAETRAELQATIQSYTEASFVSRFWQNFSGGAAAAVAAANALDEVDAAIGRVDTSSARAQQNIARYLQQSMGPAAWASLLQSADATDAKFQEVAAHAVEGGGRVNGSFREMKAGLDAYRLAHDPTIDAEKRLIGAMGELAGSTEDAEGAVDDLKTSLDALIGGPLAQEEALLNWEEAIDNLTASIKANGDSLDANTEKGRANRRAIADSVTKLKERIETDAAAGVSADKLARRMQNGADRIVETAAAAGLSEKAVRRMIHQYGLTPDMIKTVVEAAGATQSAEEVRRLQEELNALRDRTINVRTVMTTVGQGPMANRQVPQAYGGIWLERYAVGGARLPKSAMLAKDGANLVQWAEPGTGGEAFIPLAPDRRARSTAILGSVADMFGMALVQRFADGGVRTATAGAAASGVAKVVGATPAGDSAAEITRAIAAVERLTQAYANQRAMIGMNGRERRRYALEAQMAANAERLQARLTVAANREQWRFQQLGAQQQIAAIDQRLKKEKKYSNEWMSLQQQRASIVDQVRAAEQRAAEEAARAAEEAARAAEEAARAAAEHQQMLSRNQADWEFEHMNAEQQIAELERRMSLEQTFTDNWISWARQREGLIREQAEAQRQLAEEVERQRQETERQRQEEMNLFNQRRSQFQEMMGWSRPTRGASASVDRLLRNAAAQSSRFAEWSAGLDQLRRMGLQEPALASLGVLAGPAQLEQVRRLLQSSTEQVRALNAAVQGQIALAGRQVSVTQYASGGIAQVATGVRVWAEPETGGEAYIPLARSKRAASSRILSDVAHRFGYDLVNRKSPAPVVVVGGGGGGEEHHYNVQTTSQADPAEIARAIAWRQRLRGRR